MEPKNARSVSCARSAHPRGVPTGRTRSASRGPDSPWPPATSSASPRSPGPASGSAAPHPSRRRGRRSAPPAWSASGGSACRGAAQSAGPVLVEGDGRRSAALVGPPAAAGLAALRDVGPIPLHLQALEQGGLVVTFVRHDLPARLAPARRRVVLCGSWILLLRRLWVAATGGLQVSLGSSEAHFQ